MLSLRTAFCEGCFGCACDAQISRTKVQQNLKIVVLKYYKVLQNLKLVVLEYCEPARARASELAPPPHALHPLLTLGSPRVTRRMLLLSAHLTARSRAKGEEEWGLRHARYAVYLLTSTRFTCFTGTQSTRSGT